MGTLHTIENTDAKQFAESLQGSPQQRANAILAAARTGLPLAKTMLGQILLEGHGIEQDRSLALTWFNIAASQGDAMALNMLGRCHEHGWGVERNEPMAVAFYQKAANLKLDWAQYNLANLLATGRGIARDQKQAFALYLQAATQGHAKSMNLVGRSYEDGTGVSTDKATALEWYRRSAEAGDFRGQYSLASVLLSKGDVAQACGWLQGALQDGNLNFLRATRAALLQAEHAEVREIALAFHARAAQLGDASDQAAYAQVAAAQPA